MYKMLTIKQIGMSAVQVSWPLTPWEPTAVSSPDLTVMTRHFEWQLWPLLWQTRETKVGEILLLKYTNHFKLSIINAHK